MLKRFPDRASADAFRDAHGQQLGLPAGKFAAWLAEEAGGPCLIWIDDAFVPAAKIVGGGTIVSDATRAVDKMVEAATFKQTADAAIARQQTKPAVKP